MYISNGVFNFFLIKNSPAVPLMIQSKKDFHQNASFIAYSSNFSGFITIRDDVT
jgi:hypothetical protein